MWFTASGSGGGASALATGAEGESDDSEVGRLQGNNAKLICKKYHKGSAQHCLISILVILRKTLL